MDFIFLRLCLLLRRAGFDTSAIFSLMLRLRSADARCKKALQALGGGRPVDGLLDDRPHVPLQLLADRPTMRRSNPPPAHRLNATESSPLDSAIIASKLDLRDRAISSGTGSRGGSGTPWEGAAIGCPA